MASYHKSCPICKCSIPSLQHLLNHLRIFHASDPNFNVLCGLSGCTTTFRTFSGLYSHIYRHHSEVINKRRKYPSNLAELEADSSTCTLAIESSSCIEQG